jgi:hypothetical protein
MLGRRQWIAGATTLAAARPGWSAEPIEVLTADVRPLSIADGPRRGIVLDIVRDCLTAAGCEVRFTFLPFAEALQRTQAQPGALMAPLARSPQREAGFAWIGKVIDVPQAMGRLRGRPTVDLAEAGRLARIGVVKAGVQEGFPQGQGLREPHGVRRRARRRPGTGRREDRRLVRDRDRDRASVRGDRSTPVRSRSGRRSRPRRSGWPATATRVRRRSGACRRLSPSCNVRARSSACTGLMCRDNAAIFCGIDGFTEPVQFAPQRMRLRRGGRMPCVH